MPQDKVNGPVIVLFIRCVIGGHMFIFLPSAHAQPIPVPLGLGGILVELLALHPNEAAQTCLNDLRERGFGWGGGREGTEAGLK